MQVPRQSAITLKLRTSQRHVAAAERLASENGGILPVPGHLQRTGHGALIDYIRQYPSLFKHIPQLRRREQALRKHIATAEQLADEHDGILPSPHWLITNGHYTIYLSMKIYSERFAHIPQTKSRKYRTKQENVALAEQLAQQHGGKLPCYRWLRMHGYNGLQMCMYYSPHLFAHIQQIKHYKTFNDYLTLAQELAAQHGGILPAPSWLRKNHYYNLQGYMKTHRNLFKHIKQAKKLKTPQEHVIYAGQLAQQYNGVLPSPKWLRKNGHAGLYICMLKNSELFKHIKQHRKHKSSEENVVLAGQLAQQNNGALPSSYWLQKNGYNGLYKCMRRYPELFQHIQQDKMRASYFTSD